MDLANIIIKFITTVISTFIISLNPTPSPTLTPTVPILPTSTTTPTPKPTSTTKPTLKPSPTSVSIFKHEGGATVTNADTCLTYNFTAPSSSIKIIIKPSSNQNDGKMKLVEIRSPGCSSMNNKSTDKQVKNTFSNEFAFGNLYPGNYKIRIAHGTGLSFTSEYSINVSSGETSTIEVSIP